MTSIEVPTTPQEPQPQEPKPQEPQQQPAAKMPAQPQEPSVPPPAAPPDFEDKLARFLKARADNMQKGLVDDRGRVLREPLSADDAMRNAISYLPKYLSTEYGPDNLREYMAGGKMPTNGWLGSTGVIKSQETQELEWRAMVGREQHPVYAAVRDYVVDPLGNILPAALQVGADVIVGGARAVGLAPEGARVDVKAKFHGLTGTTREELDAIANTASVPAKIVQGAADLGGTAWGFSGGPVGRVLNVGGKVVGGVGKALFGATGQAVGHAAGVFGTYEGLVAENGKRMEGFAKGAATGALMGAAQQVASLALRKMFSSAVSSLGPDEKSAMDALKKWAGENKVFAERGESPLAYEKRVVDTWISAGLPGAPKMPARTLINAAVKGGADAIGFSLIDQQFREDLLDAAWHGDTKKWESVVTKFGGNFLGAAALHMPLSSIVPWQRRVDVEPTGKISDAQPVIGDGKIVDQPQPDGLQQLIEARQRTVARMRDIIEARYRRQGVQVGDPTAERLYTGDAATKLPELPTPSGERPSVAENLVTLGWEPPPEPPAKDVSVTISGNAIERLRQTSLLNPSSPAAKQLAGMDAKGDLLMRPKDARRFLRDWDARRAEIEQTHGRATVDTIDAVAASVADAIGAERPKRLKGFGTPGEKVQGPEGFAGKPIGEPYRGDAPMNAEPREGVSDAPVRIELSGTGHSFDVTGDIARPSKAMRDALGLPKEMPAKDLVEVAETASLASALHTKAALPGDEVAIGMRATPGRGDEPPIMRRVVLGEVQESPLQPNLEWKPASSVPDRGRDALDPDQAQAVSMLRAVSEQTDIAPKDRSLLNGSIDVLDSVAARNDQSVAETMAVLPQLTEAIAKGEPGAVKALAESLTTKTPEKALADAKRRVDSRPVSEADPKEAGPWYVLIRRDGRLSKPLSGPYETHGEAMSAVREVERMAEESDPWAAFDTTVTAKMPNFQGKTVFGKVDGRVMKRNPYTGKMEPVREPPPGESGSGPGPDMIRETAERAVDALEMGAAPVANVARRAWDSFQRSQIQRVEDMGMRDIAELGRDATTATKRFQSRLDSFGLMDLRRQKRSELDSMQDLVGDGNGGFADRYARAMDEATARHFGEAELSDAERKIVAMGRRVTLEAGRIAEELGVQTTDSNGKNPRPFKADPDRRVLVREYTPEMQEARIKRSGPLFDAMVSWLEKTYGWTPKEAAEHFSDAMGLTSVDATEIRRSIPVVPTHLEVPGQGVVRVLESRPLEHAERLAFRNSQVMGARSVLPRNIPEPEKGARTFPTEANLEPLPQTAQRLVDKVLNEKGPDAAEAVARMVRAMHGMPLQRQPKLFTPGEPGYHFVKVMNHLLGVRKAAALTMSFAANIAEPISNAAHFGATAVGAGYREAMRALVTGRFADLHREAVRDGFVADTKLNDPWKGDNAVETVENSLKKVGEILTTPLRMTQDLNEMVSYVAARERLAAMKDGQGTREDASALSLLGFKGPEVDAMLRGQGTPEQYERYQRNIVGKLAGGRSLRSAEKSDLAHSQKFNSLVWFTGFFQARAAAMDQLVRDIAQNKGDRAAAFGQMAKFAAATTIAGIAGNLFKQYLLGGTDGMADYVREKTSDGIGDTSLNLLGMFASGVVGGLGQPVADAFTALGEPGDSGDKWGKTALRIIGPLDVTRQFADYMRSAFFGVDVPGYENKDLLGKTAKYLRDVMPAAKAIHEGLFGASMLAISEKSIELDNAQDSYYRWIREHRPEEFAKRGGDTAETRAWRDSMRSVMDLVAAGKTWTDEDLVAAVVDAEAAKMAEIEAKQNLASEQGAKASKRRSLSEIYRDARQAVSSSLRTRQMLPNPGEMSNEELDSLMRHLGDKNAQTLRDYDEVLEVMAKRVHGANLRGQANARRQ